MSGAEGHHRTRHQLTAADCATVTVNSADGAMGIAAGGEGVMAMAMVGWDGMARWDHMAT